jgi:ribonuclease E
LASDVYGWSWPARLSGEDPYEWRGPVPRTPANDQPDETVIQASEPVAEAVAASVEPDIQTSEADEPAAVGAASGAQDAQEIWVELHDEPAKAPRPGRARARGRGAAPSVDGASEQAPPAARSVDAAQADVEPAASPPPKPSKPLPAAPDLTVVAEQAVSPLAPPATPPDPADILAPAAAPRRGWWRRGA